MKRSRILIVISCLVHVLCTGQAYFDNFYYTGSNNLLSCHAITRADSGFAFVNYIRDSITGRQDFGMIRLDKNGNEVVRKTSNIFNLDYLTYMQGMKHFIAATPCSYFLTTNTPNALGGYDVILNKINRNTLDTIKTVFYPGGIYGLSLNCFIKMSDNKYLLIGDKGTSTGGQPMILEIDSNLTAISNTTINWYTDFYCNHAVYNSDTKRILLSGKTATGQYPVTLVEIDTLGTVLNSKLSASSFTTLIGQIFYSHLDTTYVCIGAKVKAIYSGQHKLRNLCVTKYDKNLDMLWQKSYGDYAYLNGIGDAVILADGSIVASGNYSKLTSAPLANADQNAILFKVDKDGHFKWMQEYSHIGPGIYREAFYGIDTTREGGFIACGNVMGYPNAKAWAIKTNSLGCVLPGCISSTVSVDSVVIPSIYIAPPPPIDTSTVGMKKEFKDYGISVFPNPVKDLLFIKTDLSEQLHLTLTDVYGRELMSWLFQSKTEVKTEQFPEGVYFLKIERKSEIIYTSKILKE